MANHKQHHNCHETQLQFAAHIRHPQQNPAPADIEDRRLAIYRNLFYNNIESFLASGFPVLKSIIEEAHWHSMVRDFIHRHQSHSPLFLKISEEFLSYLQTERTADARDPEFMLELAHYEWVELALDISTIDIPNNLQPQANMLDDIPQLSPTAWRFTYQYPVHRIGPQYQPAAGQIEPTSLIVYRTRALQIGFMETNPITLRLLDIIESQQCSGRQAIVKLAEEINHPEPDSLVEFGAEIISQLYNKDIISGFRPN